MIDLATTNESRNTSGLATRETSGQLRLVWSKVLTYSSAAQVLWEDLQTITVPLPEIFGQRHIDNARTRQRTNAVTSMASV
ncbi:hypothetical protein ACT691_18935 [Vibrio metschnikovii]